MDRKRPRAEARRAGGTVMTKWAKAAYSGSSRRRKSVTAAATVSR